jgi:putative secretion ATPase (PEP-CTERM system associated)
MYEAFYNLTEKPFTLLPDPGFLYLSDKHQMALTLLDYGLHDHAGFTVISGEIGAGKTTLIRHLLNNMEQEFTVGLITNTHQSFGELLQWVLHAFGLEHKDMSRVEMHQCFIDFIIDEYAHNRRTVLIVDEAQNMDAATLEELRMLSNINADKHQALQVILVGQRELRQTLQRPDLVQFAQRITVDYHLEPLSEAQTAAYIRHRMQTAGGDPATFSSEACAAVYRYSNGVPRLINLLCDTALVYGYAEQSRTIDAKLVTDVARDKQQSGIFPIYAVATRETAAQPTDTESAAVAAEDTGSARSQTGSVAVELATHAARPDTQVPVTDADDSRQPDSGKDEPLWLPARKQSLRIAVCSAEEDLRRYLSRLLEAYGHKVTASLPVDVATFEYLECCGLNDFDAVLIDRDTSNPLASNAASIIANWDLPVLYNDSTATARNLRMGNPDFGQELSEQLLALVNSSSANIAAL